MTVGPQTRAAEREKTGLTYWMDRVLKEHAKFDGDFSGDTVHDLRVALRRCTLMAGIMKGVDQTADWKQMRRGARRLFRPLGQLRNVQLQMEWLEKLGAAEKSSTGALLEKLKAEAEKHRTGAQTAVREFDRKQWKTWTRDLSSRFRRVVSDKPACKSIALERWDDVRDMQRRLQKTQSRVAYHRLRIAIKKFRYTIENFLPPLYAGWAPDLKHFQDLLGDIHDLDLLSGMIVKNRRIVDGAARSRWTSKIEEQRNRLIQQFRAKIAGKGSPVWIWREGLPGERELKSAGLARLALWGSFLTPDFADVRRVARLALQLYDGCANCGLVNKDQTFEERFVLRAAALLQDVGRSKRDKAHHKVSYRMICKAAVPPGWSKKELDLAAVVARFHRGALSRPNHKILRGYLPHVRHSLILLAAILRLANVFSAKQYRSVRRLDVENRSGVIVVRAEGYTESDPLASKLTVAKHFLEFACQHPVHILPSSTGILVPHLVRSAAQIDAA